MLLTMVALYDEVVDSFQAPMTFHNSEEAVRYFQFLAKGDDSNVGRFPLHHHLYLVGEFESDTGVISFRDKPSLLISGSSVSKESE